MIQTWKIMVISQRSGWVTLTRPMKSREIVPPFRTSSLSVILSPLSCWERMSTRDGTISILLIGTKKMSFSPTTIRCTIRIAKSFACVVVVGTMATELWTSRFTRRIILFSKIKMSGTTSLSIYKDISNSFTCGTTLPSTTRKIYGSPIRKMCSCSIELLLTITPSTKRERMTYEPSQLFTWTIILLSTRSSCSLEITTRILKGTIMMTILTKLSCWFSLNSMILCYRIRIFASTSSISRYWEWGLYI